MGQSITEPSMEDILASIKRIIDEDAKVAAPPQTRARGRPVAVPDPVPEPTAIEPAADRPDTAAAPDPVPAADADVLELTSPIGAPDGWQPAILSATAEQASRSAFQSLSRLQIRAAETAQPATLEGLVCELIRPMLRDWLDRELPAVVERIVTAEVRRLTNEA